MFKLAAKSRERWPDADETPTAGRISRARARPGLSRATAFTRAPWAPMIAGRAPSGRRSPRRRGPGREE